MSSPTSSYSDISVSDSDSGDFTIRPLKAADIPQVCELHSSILGYPYPPSYLRQCLLHSTHLCLLAFPSSPSPSSTPIAFLTASIHTPVVDLKVGARRKEAGKGEVDVLTLGVHPDWRRRGVARRLVLTAVHKLLSASSPSFPPLPSPELEGTKVTAHVATANTNALPFYAALGMDAGLDDLAGDLYRGVGRRDAFVLSGRVR